uniref:Chalcone-flavonone isomerase family protein n=1 Tax=Tradescantia hirsutiflora TaxID=428262 RepID=A0A1D8BEK7_9LILI|nr:chalcone-flavanone isomerase CHI2b [Tradescantia hirsutiflora]
MESLWKGHNVHGIHFPPAVTSPGSTDSLFLAGAGPRGMNIAGEFILFTAIAIYFHDNAIKILAPKWKGKSETELNKTPDFYRDIYSGNFEKMTRVTMVHALTGPEYSDKVTENCMNAWKAAGVFTQDKAEALDQFKEAFKYQDFPPGGTIFFTHLPASNELTIAFSKDGAIPKKWNAVIKNEALSEAILQSIIGEHGVSRGARKNIALRMSKILGNPDPSAKFNTEL